ncbi:hypothetical protein RND81_08G045100 [Saponaria officinalis]|uniref:Uncharacterized protein n=1 Tax=Saponaria officinalis TaxID=3572 RepID=A0AAW1J374_SAPOF
MARQLTQTLTLTLKKFNPNFTSLFCRNLFSNKAQLIEVDLQSSSSSSGGEIEVVTGIHHLEDAIHGIIVRRLQPDWLPFRPGSSYWVPPRTNVADNLVQLVGKLTNPLTHEESLSLVSTHGWPSSSYFIDQGSPPMVEMLVYSPKSENESSSEDED